MLEKDSLAPNFSSVDQNNNPIKLADYLNQKNIVLYFYPKDDTPGCTIEAKDFTELGTEFEQLDTVIIGVSADDCASHQAFINKFDLNLILLADTDGDLCHSFDVWHEQEWKGKKFMGITRSTFIIDKSGNLAYTEYAVQAQGHAQKILDFIKKHL